MSIAEDGKPIFNRIRPNSEFLSRFIASLERSNSKLLPQLSNCMDVENSDEATEENESYKSRCIYSCLPLPFNKDKIYFLKAFRKEGRSQLLKLAKYYGIRIKILGDIPGQPPGCRSPREQEKTETEISHNSSAALEKEALSTSDNIISTDIGATIEKKPRALKDGKRVIDGAYQKSFITTYLSNPKNKVSGSRNAWNYSLCSFFSRVL